MLMFRGKTTSLCGFYIASFCKFLRPPQVQYDFFPVKNLNKLYITFLTNTIYI